MELQSGLRKALRRLTLLAGASLPMAGAVAMPLADPVVTRSETVKYSQGEAMTAEGAAVLYGKLQAAADRVCRDAYVASSQAGYNERESYGSCVAGALDKAVAAVGIPSVSLLHMQEMADGKVLVAHRR